MSSKKIHTFASDKTPGSKGLGSIRINLPDNSDLLKQFKRNEKYEHMALVGKGGMGTVTLSRDKNTLRKVAIKTLNEELISNPEAVIRFSEEAQITAQLEHPNIIPVYEMGIDENKAPFYSMKYVKGTNLKEILKLLKDNNKIILKKFHIIELLNIFVKVCDAMAFACSKGVLHRDLKPENIMIGEFGEVLIVDWGLAKTFSTVKSSESSEKEFSEQKLVSEISSFIESNIDTIRTLNNVSLSLDHCLIGSPQYMAPERIVGNGDERSEVFALGTILYDILALSNMFQGEKVKDVLENVAVGNHKKLSDYRKLPHIQGGKIPLAMSAVVEKATQSNPDERYSTIKEFKSEIEAYILGYATKAERAGFFRLLKLGLIRHKKVSFLLLTAMIAILSISSVFIYELVHSRQNALNKSNYASFLEETAKRKSFQVSQKSEELENKIDELKSHTDIIIGNALHEADQLNFEAALSYIQYVIELDPENEEVYWHQGRIYLTVLSFKKSIEAFKKVKPDNPDYKKSLEFLSWSEKLYLKEKNQTNSKDDLVELFEFLKSKGEFSEAIAVLDELESHKDYDKMLRDVWILRLRRSQLRNVIDLESTKIITNNGKFLISFKNAPIFDLSPLAKMPINDLSITNCKINNLDALREMPLERLLLDNTGVTSLEPISGKTLISISLQNLKLKDISPLKGMTLRRLFIQNCPIENLNSLNGMITLDNLVIENTPIVSLAPLRGLRLKHLNAQHTKIKSIAPLKGMPLKTLILNFSQVNNLTILKTVSPQILELNDTLVTHIPDINVSKLEKISLSDSPVQNIRTLRNAPLLREVSISNTQITDISALKGKDIESLHMTGTPVKKIAPVISDKLKYLYMTGTNVTDFNSLKGAKNLKILHAQNCGIVDISSLVSKNLRELELSENLKLKSIETLRGLDLEILKLRATSVCDISPLQNQPITYLDLEGLKVTNLEAIPSMKKLKNLNILDCKKIHSLKPILENKSIETLRFHPRVPDAQLLKGHPSIKRLSVKGNARQVHIFWEFFDSRYGKN